MKNGKSEIFMEKKITLKPHKKFIEIQIEAAIRASCNL